MAFLVQVFIFIIGVHLCIAGDTPAEGTAGFFFIDRIGASVSFAEIDTVKLYDIQLSYVNEPNLLAADGQADFLCFADRRTTSYIATTDLQGVKGSNIVVNITDNIWTISSLSTVPSEKKMYWSLAHLTNEFQQNDRNTSVIYSSNYDGSDVTPLLSYGEEESAGLPALEANSIAVDDANMRIFFSTNGSVAGNTTYAGIYTFNYNLSYTGPQNLRLYFASSNVYGTIQNLIYDPNQQNYLYFAAKNESGSWIFRIAADSSNTPPELVVATSFLLYTVPIGLNQIWMYNATGDYNYCNITSDGCSDIVQGSPQQVNVSKDFDVVANNAVDTGVQIVALDNRKTDVCILSFTALSSTPNLTNVQVRFSKNTLLYAEQGTYNIYLANKDQIDMIPVDNPSLGQRLGVLDIDTKASGIAVIKNVIYNSGYETGMLYNTSRALGSTTFMENACAGPMTANATADMLYWASSNTANCANGTYYVFSCKVTNCQATLMNITSSIQPILSIALDEETQTLLYSTPEGVYRTLLQTAGSGTTVIQTTSPVFPTALAYYEPNDEFYFFSVEFDFADGESNNTQLLACYRENCTESVRLVLDVKMHINLDLDAGENLFMQIDPVSQYIYWGSTLSGNIFKIDMNQPANEVAFNVTGSLLGMGLNISSSELWITHTGKPNTFEIFNITAGTLSADCPIHGDKTKDFTAGAVTISSYNSIYYQDHETQRVHECIGGCNGCDNANPLTTKDYSCPWSGSIAIANNGSLPIVFSLRGCGGILVMTQNGGLDAPILKPSESESFSNIISTLVFAKSYVEGLGQGQIYYSMPAQQSINGVTIDGTPTGTFCSGTGSFDYIIMVPGGNQTLYWSSLETGKAQYVQLEKSHQSPQNFLLPNHAPASFSYYKYLPARPPPPSATPTPHVPTGNSIDWTSLWVTLGVLGGIVVLIVLFLGYKQLQRARRREYESILTAD